MSPPVICAVRGCDEDSTNRVLVMDAPFFKTDDEALLVCDEHAELITVHHLDGDKANCRWWNLAALCQRCHLTIQGRVKMAQVFPFEHSEWFKPHAAGYYALTYLGEELDRDAALERMDELLALERAV